MLRVIIQIGDAGMASQSVQLSYEKYLSMDLSQYVGKWVAISQTGEIITSGSLSKLMEVIEEKNIKNPLIKKIRSEEEMWIL
ncbi:MAG: hypothetical protein JW834_01730 [Candidatus Diapherotrites archaeon]|nr:hypothetical protein [Candidatus Diapherotrites archaeon]